MEVMIWRVGKQTGLLVLESAAVRCDVGNRNLLRFLGRNVVQLKCRSHLDNSSMVELLWSPCRLCLDYCLEIGRDGYMFDG